MADRVNFFMIQLTIQQLHMLSKKLVKKLPRKKVVLLIVEGPSDQDSLELIFNKLFPNDKIMVCVMHCDITTEGKNNFSNIVDAVTKRVK